MGAIYSHEIASPSISLSTLRQSLKPWLKISPNGTGIDVEHVSATWEFLASGHYAVAGKSAQRQPSQSHPVLVDLLAPGFNPSATVEKMLTTVASSIANRTRVPIAKCLYQSSLGSYWDGVRQRRDCPMVTCAPNQPLQSTTASALRLLAVPFVASLLGHG
jgi:hypothetical protein